MTAAITWPGNLAGAEPGPGAWAKRAPLLEANSEFAVTQLDGKVYVIGGYLASRDSQATVQVYDAKTDTWSLGPPLPEPTNHDMAAAVGGKVYVIGGHDGSWFSGFVDTVFALDPNIGKWIKRAPMPTKRSAAVTAVIDGKIYVAGGRPPHGNDFAAYDPKTDTWETLPDLPSQRNHLAGAAIDGKFHVVGGRLGPGYSSGKTAAHEVFDPKIRTWSTAAPMLKPRSGINGVMANGCFHVWGGEEGAGMFPDHDYYDPRTDTWTKLPDMVIPVHGVTGAAFLNGLIYATGGGTGVGGGTASLFNQVYRPAVSCQ